MRRLLFLVFTLASVITSTGSSDTPQSLVRKSYASIVDSAPVTKTALDSQQLDALFNHVASHRVAGLAHTAKYDHQPTGIGDREVGFCYGRAMAVHLAARRMGVDPNSIQKIYIAGDLKNSGVRWRFHMATMIRGTDDQWHIVDPIMPALGAPGVIDPAPWMQRVKEVYDLPDGTEDSKFYLSDPTGIMVDMSIIPASKDIEAQSAIIGDRLINVTFDPLSKPGFERLPTDEFGGPYDVFRITGDAKLKYLINFTEPDLSGKAVFNFDFFRFSTVIFYRTEAGSELISFLPRTYDYNGYFTDLIDAFLLDRPLPDLQ